MIFMWIWPLFKFWTYTPWGYAMAILWNMSELFKVPLPASWGPYMFGVISGHKGKRVK